LTVNLRRAYSCQRYTRSDTQETERANHKQIRAASAAVHRGFLMAVIAMFYGIIISLYFMDRDKHKRPHLHARYQEQEAVLSIPTGARLAGSLPGNKMKLVQAWIEIHQEELLADWELASQGQPVFKIEPLR